LFASIAMLVCAMPAVAAAAKIKVDGVDTPANPKAIVELQAFPPDINLTTADDPQEIIVVATRGDEITLDVTAQAEVKIADGKIAKLDGRTVRPVADGATKVIVTYAGKSVELPVLVKDAAVHPPISFNLDVMPVLTRAGCNVGSCHGAARGKDGFNLSLFGFDPNGDHFKITRELGFRRINLAIPEESMFVEKAVGAVPHTGGKRFDRDSASGRALVQWIEAGVPNDTGKVPKVVRVDLYPTQVVLEGEGATQQFIARAVYSDGSDRDVTDLAVFSSNNENSAKMKEDGQITAANRGEAFVMARFDTVTVGAQALVLPKGLKYVAPKKEPTNYIDELVNNKLEKLRILPSKICDDQTFLRRVTIDLVGLLPTEQEYADFMNDRDPNKRAKLIDRLIERPEFSEIWSLKWCEILLVRTINNRVDRKGAYLYAQWITDQIRNDVPFNETVKALLASSGGTFKTPATNYYQTELQTLKLAENTAQVFMGIRTQCAQCHNHPFDRWTMDDYYSFASFFSQYGRKSGEDPRETIIYNRGGGEVNHPVLKKSLPPKVLGGNVTSEPGKDRREVLADWLASADNPFFATSVANRVWDHFFGMGIVHPVDDIRVSNPPSNPELFEALGQHFTDYNYSLRKLIRDICNSQTYQRSTARNASNEDDEKNFAHGNVRRIRAESLLDCINEVTESRDKFVGLPAGARAVQIADGATSNYFLSTFGRSTRETVCAADVKTDPTLSQSLHLLNGATVEGKVSTGDAVKKLLASKKSPEDLIETIYLRCLTRKPTDEELSKLTAVLVSAKADNKEKEALEDIFWAVLNSREFVFNH
jgi:hypothetical protein